MLNQLARSRNLANRSNSGFNLINGYESVKVEDLVPKGLEDNFKTKVMSYHEKYTMKLPENYTKCSKYSKM